MLCRIAQWDWGHVAHATGLEFVPQNSPIMHFNKTPTQSQPPSLSFKARLSAKLLKMIFQFLFFSLIFKVRTFGTKKRSITVKYVTVKYVTGPSTNYFIPIPPHSDTIDDSSTAD